MLYRDEIYLALMMERKNSAKEINTRFFPGYNHLVAAFISLFPQGSTIIFRIPFIVLREIVLVLY